MEQIPDSSISITLIFPAINTDSENDSSSEFNETSPRFSHNSNSVVLLFPPLRSAPDSPKNSEIRITSCPILEIFPPTISETETNVSCSESNQSPRAQFSSWSPFPPAISETETNDRCSESNQSPRAQFSSWSPFPPAISETETNDRCSESNQSPRAQFSLSSLFPSAGSETDSSSSKNDEIILDQILPHRNLRIFSFTELNVATKNFSPNTRLGDGNFGQVFKCLVEDEGPSMSGKNKNFRLDILFEYVFKGWLKDKGQFKSGNRMVIAVRKLSIKYVERFQEWQLLVNFLGGLSHPNLMELLGYCWEDIELLLIYEFMQKGNLADHLLGSSAIQPLPWDLRLKIAIDAARGLAFLRTCDEQIIFEDFKASNILLDGSYTAKILIKLDPSATETLETELECYYAPWHSDTVQQNFKRQMVRRDEVYGFGVVLVQILTGLREFDTNRPSGKHYLVDWIKPYLLTKVKLGEIMDPRLEGKYPSKAIFHISQLALKCLADAPMLRPSMKEVLEILEKIEANNERPREPRNHASHPVVH